MGQTKAAETLKWDFHDLDFSVNKSRRYHEKLSAFYGRWRDRARVVTVVSGSGAFLLVASGSQVFGTLASAFVALWAVLDLILMPDKKSELHSRLQKRFTELAAELAAADQSRARLAQLKAKRLEIEADEPACKRLVDLQARNDEARARHHPPDDSPPLSGLQRRFGYYFDFDMERLERWKAEKIRAEHAAPSPPVT